RLRERPSARAAPSAFDRRDPTWGRPACAFLIRYPQLFSRFLFTHQENSMSEVSAIAISVANPGFEEKLAEALEGLLAPTHKERGVLQYEMYRDMREPRCFVFIERW